MSYSLKFKHAYGITYISRGSDWNAVDIVTNTRGRLTGAYEKLPSGEDVPLKEPKILWAIAQEAGIFVSNKVLLKSIKEDLDEGNPLDTGSIYDPVERKNEPLKTKFNIDVLDLAAKLAPAKKSAASTQPVYLLPAPSP